MAKLSPSLVTAHQGYAMIYLAFNVVHNARLTGTGSTLSRHLKTSLKHEMAKRRFRQIGTTVARLTGASGTNKLRDKHMFQVQLTKQKSTLHQFVMFGWEYGLPMSLKGPAACRSKNTSNASISRHRAWSQGGTDREGEFISPR